MGSWEGGGQTDNPALTAYNIVPTRFPPWLKRKGSENEHYVLRSTCRLPYVFTSHPLNSGERRFRAVLGRSIADEIARLRIERAKRLLAESNTSIKRLAAEAGFSDARQMCDSFKRIEGTTPIAYRRQHQRK
jgi:hypothetical protein